MNLLAFTLLLSCLPAALFDFALPKWKAEPSFRIEDAYKWTYQATRGGEHAAPDEDSARNWLDGEWKSLGEPAAGEPLWEPLCPGGEIGRLNLRPYRKRGGQPSDLVAAFLASSRDYRSDGANFLTAWLEFGRRLKKRRVGNLKFTAWEKLDAEMKAKTYPAIHHSEEYKAGKHPAYRVLTAKQMQWLVAK